MQNVQFKNIRSFDHSKWDNDSIPKFGRLKHFGFNPINEWIDKLKIRLLF